MSNTSTFDVSEDSVAPQGNANPRLLWACVAAVGAVFVVAFLPDFRWLYNIWTHQPDYSHGFLVVPLALVILWQRMRNNQFEPMPWRPLLIAWVGFVGVLVARAFFYQRGNDWATSATLIPAVFFLALALGGWELMERAWPAIAFLIFMYPLPTQVDAKLARPLQMVATYASVKLLKMTGFWVMAEGNVIHVGPYQLEVATACNGLAMLVCLAATVTAVVILIDLQAWKKLVLLVSVIPVALFCNVLRIAVTAWCYQSLGPEKAEHLAHDVAGWLMMPLAIVLVGLEIAAINWLVVEETTTDEPLLLGKPVPQKKAELEAPATEPIAALPEGVEIPLGVSRAAAPAPAGLPAPDVEADAGAEAGAGAHAEAAPEPLEQDPSDVD
ncbi:MAG: exosortase/archaeosortase family protein [Isosphaeraceae bacterium]